MGGFVHAAVPVAIVGALCGTVWPTLVGIILEMGGRRSAELWETGSVGTRTIGTWNIQMGHKLWSLVAQPLHFALIMIGKPA